MRVLRTIYGSSILTRGVDRALTSDAFAGGSYSCIPPGASGTTTTRSPNPSRIDSSLPAKRLTQLSGDCAGRISVGRTGRQRFVINNPGLIV